MKSNKVQSMINAALTSAPTAKARLEAFLALDASGLRGATNLRARQSWVRERLRLAPTYSDDHKYVGHIITGTQFGAEKPKSVCEYRRAKSSKEYRRAAFAAWELNQRYARRANKTGDDKLALALAESYHQHIQPLYRSKHASIVYADAPQSRTSWDVYAKSYKYPANWVDAAVHVEYPPTGAVAILHPVNGNAKTIELFRDAVYGHPSLLDGDLFARQRHGIIERFDVAGKHTGFAIEFPEIDRDSPHKANWTYWEHGSSIAEIRAEYKRKLELHAIRERAETERNAIAERDRKAARKHDRKIRLSRLCRNLTCTIEDARAVGFCMAGINAFRERFGIPEQATVAQLRETHDSRVDTIIRYRAKQIAIGAEVRQ